MNPSASHLPTGSFASVLDDLSLLDVYRGKGKFASSERARLPHDYPSDQRTLFAPLDDVHGALCALLKAARSSIAVSMYGFDDEEIAAIIKEKLEDENVFVQLTLDSTQAAGKHEKTLLETENYPASAVAIGRSERHAILHLKTIVLDGLVAIGGSTNLSQSGEADQANELHVARNPLIAAEYRTRLDKEHAYVMQEVTGKTVHRKSVTKS